jgi:hypothetical protein
MPTKAALKISLFIESRIPPLSESGWSGLKDGQDGKYLKQLQNRSSFHMSNLFARHLL